jgi:hypothetical protein
VDSVAVGKALMHMCQVPIVCSIGTDPAFLRGGR